MMGGEREKGGEEVVGEGRGGAVNGEGGGLEGVFGEVYNLGEEEREGRGYIRI